MLQTLITTLLFPIITDKVQELASNVKLPFTVKFKYNTLNNVLEKVIESITLLADKVISEPDSLKTEARLIGLNYALEILETISKKSATAIS